MIERINTENNNIFQKFVLYVAIIEIIEIFTNKRKQM